MKNFALDRFFGLEGLIESAKLAEQLSEESFSPKDTGLTHNIMANWHNEGLLFNKERGVMKKFNFTEYLWIKILDDLRQMGISIMVMKDLYQSLFQVLSYKTVFEFFHQMSEFKPELLDGLNADETTKAALSNFLKTGQYNQIDNNTGYSYFFMMVAETIIKKSPLSLIVFKDGTFLPWSEEKASFYSKEDHEKLTFQTHIRISLSEKIKEFLLDDRSIFKLPSLKLITPGETKLLQMISSGEYDSITINFQKKKAKSMRLVKSQDVKKKLVDILREGSYQDIEITSHDGVVSKIKNTIKVNLE